MITYGIRLVENIKCKNYKTSKEWFFSEDLLTKPILGAARIEEQDWMMGSVCGPVGQKDVLTSSLIPCFQTGWLQSLS